MHTEMKRDWDHKEWEDFARRLVQVRHDPDNVQSVPDRVRGDAGIEFLTTNGCCYQCYAPEQSTDTSKAASAMKAKATRDLQKLRKNVNLISELLGSRKIRRWILLCPFLDDKSVIAHLCRTAVEHSISTLSFVSDDFHPLVQSPDDFGSELATLRSRSQGIPIEARSQSFDQVPSLLQKVATQIDPKLERGFPQLTPEARDTRANNFIRAHVQCMDVLDQMKYEFPDSWEAYRRTSNAEETRLRTVGSGPGDAFTQLETELNRLERQLSAALPFLDRATITIVSTGTLATWLIECPLDFEIEAGK